MYSLIQKFKNLELYWKISLILIIILPFLLILSWLKHIDEWFALTNYYYFFSNPANINYSFMYYLNDLIWSLFIIIFSKLWIWELLAIRIWWIFLLWGIFYSLFILLKWYIKIEYILIWSFISLLFLTTTDLINWVQYNYVTTLFYLISFIFLSKWLFKNNKLFLLLGWFFIWINIFSKLTNIVWLIFLVLIPIFYYLKSNKIVFNKAILLDLFYYILGLILWFLLLIIFIIKIWHIELFLDSIKSIFLLSKEWVESNHHGFSFLLYTYIRNFIFSFFISALLLGYFIFIKRYFKNKFVLFIGVILPGVIVWIINILKFYVSFYIFGLNLFIDYLKFSIPFFSLLFLFYFLKEEKNLELKFLAILSIFFLFFVSFWSGAYIETMQNWIYIILPILIYYIYDKNINNYIIRYYLYFIIIVSILTSSYFWVLHLNNVFSNKTLNYINNDYILSDKSLKEISLKLNNNKDDILFIWNYSNFSYLYSYLNIKPFLWTSVPSYYPLQEYKNRLNLSIIDINNNKKKYPTIIFLSDDYEEKSLVASVFKKNNLEYKNFTYNELINKYNYIKFFENNKFIIYKK